MKQLETSLLDQWTPSNRPFLVSQRNVFQQNPKNVFRPIKLLTLVSRKRALNITLHPQKIVNNSSLTRAKCHFSAKETKKNFI